MNGAQSLLKTFVAAGLEVCFTNPGTSEMHFVAALDKQPGMRAVLCLFEGVVTGAADGYARMAGKPACTLLHLGPGLANGLANLHNARRARSPIVNVVGEHATYHRALDAPLSSDIAGFAGPVSAWIHMSENAGAVAGDAAAAVQAAVTPPGRIATLILPADAAWNEAPGAAAPLPAPGLTPADPNAVEAVIAALRSGEPCTFLLNGVGVSENALRLVSSICHRTGARFYGDTFLARVSRGAGRVDLPRLPYFAEQALETLAGTQHLIVVETKPPVSFFAYPGVPSELTPEGCRVHALTTPGEDTVPALEAVAEAVGALGAEPSIAKHAPPGLPNGPLDPQAIACCIGALLPEQSVVVNEAVTAGFALPGMTASAAPHDWLELTGGAIGQGLPTAVGAALACPDRRVVAMQADGSAMYTIQSLWSMARENLDVTVVLLANRKYAILQVELMRVGAENPGPKAMSMLDLSHPDLDFVHLAKGMGVPAVRATDAKSLAGALAESFATPGPYLIEAIL